jgi:glycosyltransferase involved in cell wall biosynthesis
MNILIDAHFLDQKKEGNRTFILSLLTGINKLQKDVRDVELFLPVYRKAFWQNTIRNDHFHWLNCSREASKRYLIEFPRMIRKHSIDLVQNIYHFPFFLDKKVKKVLVVHDLLPFSRPDLFGTGFGIRFRNLVRLSERKAHSIICGSRFTRNEILRYLHTAVDKIKVVYYGIDLELNKPVPSLSDRYSWLKRIEKPFALFVGRLDRRKRISFLLDMAEQLYERWGVRLVVVGKRESISQRQFKRLKEMENLKKVFYPGEIPDGDLEFLFRKADLLLYFSESEGFGFPIIEAMKFGLPYLTVNRGALKEIAVQEAFVDFGNMEALVRKAGDLIQNQSLRKDFIKKSKVNLNKFSHVAMAARILDIYRDLLENNPDDSAR